MKLDQLQYFIEAARNEHIGRSAKVLGISQSAISHSIAALEDELGQKLFVRQGKRVFLTPHGKRLAERSSEILQELTTLKTELSSDETPISGAIRIAATHGLSSRFLAPAFARVSRMHPKLAAELSTLRSADVHSKVVTGELDLGLCFSPRSHPKIASKQVVHGKLLIAARHGHPIFKQKMSQRVKALSSFPSAAPKASHGIENCESHPILEKLGIQSPVTLIFDSYEVAVNHLLETDCWTLLPDWEIKKAGPRRIMQVLESQPSAPIEISFIWSKDRPLGRGSKKIMEEAIHSFNSTGAKVAR